MSSPLKGGRYAPADIDLLLRDEQAKWTRRPYAFLRDIPSHPESPLSYYRFRSGRTFFLRLCRTRLGENHVEIELSAEEQPGCLSLRRQPPPESARFTVFAPR